MKSPLRAFYVGDESGHAAIQASLARTRTEVVRMSHGASDLTLRRADLLVYDEDAGLAGPQRRALFASLKRAKKPFIIVSSSKDTAAILRAKKDGASDYIPKPFHQREFILRFNAVAQKKARIACIGGGTGLFTLLLGLKQLPNALITSVVNMSDDGGSSGKLSQSFGILPPGDIRRSLVALSNAPELMNEIIQHRFDRGGDLKGHSFGNLFLTVLAEVTGSMSDAVRALSDILNIQGIALPATRTLTRLTARFKSGRVVRGESKIDLCEGRGRDERLVKLWHEPEAECDADAYASILFADIVTIGPGDLYTSVITNLVVKKLREAVVLTRARKIYICNLMTKPGETSGYGAVDHVREVVRYLGKDVIDYVILSNTPVSGESLAEYLKKHQTPILPETASLKRITRAKVVAADVGSDTELVRHDGMKLKKEIERIVTRELGPS